MLAISHIQRHIYSQVLAVMLVLWLVPFSAAGFFYSQTSATESRFAAGSLALEPVIPAKSLLTVGTSTTDSTTVAINTLANSVPAQYQLAVQETDNSAFCSQVLLAANDPDGGVATSTVANFASTELGTFGTWELDFSILAAPTGTSTECGVTFVVDAWNEGMQKGTGFIDQATFTITVQYDNPSGGGGGAGTTGAPLSTNTVVLNEIYANPVSASSSPFNREWVELYNGTDDPVDVLHWVITEQIATGGSAGDERGHRIYADCDDGAGASVSMQPIGTTNTIIPAGGHLAIQFCGSANNSYMSVNGDTIRLYATGDYNMATDTAINPPLDSYTYTSTVQGKSDARIPDGGGWVDPIPTPGAPNTATRADLEAEGWSEEKIQKTLKLLGQTDDCVSDGNADGGTSGAGGTSQDDGDASGPTTGEAMRQDDEQSADSEQENRELKTSSDLDKDGGSDDGDAGDSNGSDGNSSNGNGDDDGDSTGNGDNQGGLDDGGKDINRKEGDDEGVGNGDSAEAAIESDTGAGESDDEGIDAQDGEDGGTETDGDRVNDEDADTGSGEQELVVSEDDSSADELVVDDSGTSGNSEVTSEEE